MPREGVIVAVSPIGPGGAQNRCRLAASCHCFDVGVRQADVFELACGQRVQCVACHARVVPCGYGVDDCCHEAERAGCNVSSAECGAVGCESSHCSSPFECWPGSSGLDEGHLGLSCTLSNSSLCNCDMRLVHRCAMTVWVNYIWLKRNDRCPWVNAIQGKIASQSGVFGCQVSEICCAAAIQARRKPPWRMFAFRATCWAKR